MKKSLNILIADDDLDDQSLIHHFVKQCSAEVFVTNVYDGVQLWDVLSKGNNGKNGFRLPNLIFLDLNMPNVDGFQILKKIKSETSLKEIPIYVITVSRSKQEREKALSLGAAGFYSKGNSATELERIVKEICSKNLSHENASG